MDILMVRQEENGRKAGVEGETGQDDLALISGYPDSVVCIKQYCSMRNYFSLNM